MQDVFQNDYSLNCASGLEVQFQSYLVGTKIHSHKCGCKRLFAVFTAVLSSAQVGRLSPPRIFRKAEDVSAAVLLCRCFSHKVGRTSSVVSHTVLLRDSAAASLLKCFFEQYSSFLQRTTILDKYCPIPCSKMQWCHCSWRTEDPVRLEAERK